MDFTSGNTAVGSDAAGREHSATEGQQQPVHPVQLEGS